MSSLTLALVLLNYFCFLTVSRIARSSSTDVLPTLNLLKPFKYASTTQALPPEASFFTFLKFSQLFPVLNAQFAHILFLIFRNSDRCPKCD
jgi:hypothetical protein